MLLSPASVSSLSAFGFVVNESSSCSRGWCDRRYSTSSASTKPAAPSSSVLVFSWRARPLLQQPSEEAWSSCWPMTLRAVSHALPLPWCWSCCCWVGCSSSFSRCCSVDVAYSCQKNVGSMLACVLACACGDYTHAYAHTRHTHHTTPKLNPLQRPRVCAPAEALADRDGDIAALNAEVDRLRAAAVRQLHARVQLHALRVSGSVCVCLCLCCAPSDAVPTAPSVSLHFVLGLQSGSLPSAESDRLKGE